MGIKKKVIKEASGGNWVLGGWRFFGRTETYMEEF